MGAAELATGSVQGRMMEIQQASVEMAGHSRLEQIRASMRDEFGQAGASDRGAWLGESQLGGRDRRGQGRIVGSENPGRPARPARLCRHGRTVGRRVEDHQRMAMHDQAGATDPAVALSESELARARVDAAELR